MYFVINILSQQVCTAFLLSYTNSSELLAVPIAYRITSQGACFSLAQSLKFYTPIFFLLMIHAYNVPEEKQAP